jgi:hypothetical protein
MNQDMTEGPPIRLRDIPELPMIGPRRNGRKLNVRTAFRWATSGVRGVVLQTFLQGGQRFTTVAALRRFFAALEQVSPITSGAAKVVPNNRRTHTPVSNVEEELNSLGITDAAGVKHA